MNALSLNASQNQAPALTESAIIALVSDYKKSLGFLGNVYAGLDACPDLYSILPKGIAGQSAFIVSKDEAKKSLDCIYWEKLIELSRVREILPSSEMKKWYSQIKNQDVPDFSYEIVVSTLQAWLDQQGEFVLDRADTIFHALSPEHITNSPSGFSKRMILKDIWSAGYIKSDNIGPIADLRWLLAYMSKRASIGKDSPYTLLTAVGQNKGTWVSCDGGNDASWLSSHGNRAY